VTLLSAVPLLRIVFAFLLFAALLLRGPLTNHTSWMAEFDATLVDVWGSESYHFTRLSSPEVSGTVPMCDAEKRFSVDCLPDVS
jgi:hypothetical protein